MVNLANISKNKVKDLSKLKQKKHRLEAAKVVVEGLRTLMQLKEYGICPVEQYIVEGQATIWDTVPAFMLKEWEMQQICDSEHSQGLAAIFELPLGRQASFTKAFLLDEISDPGNLGTIFRIAEAFGIQQLFLTPGCVEVTSPKVIRASLGSVFHVPFYQLEYEQLAEFESSLVVTDARRGLALKDFHPSPEDRIIVVLGSEAHGISRQILDIATQCIRIEMNSSMESLNVAVAAGIIGHHIYQQ